MFRIPLGGKVLRSTKYFIIMSYKREHENTPAQEVLGNKRPCRVDVLLPFEACRASKYMWKGGPRGQERTRKISQKHQPQRSTDMWANHSQRLPVTQRFLNLSSHPPASFIGQSRQSRRQQLPAAQPGLGKCDGVQSERDTTQTAPKKIAKL